MTIRKILGFLATLFDGRGLIETFRDILSRDAPPSAIGGDAEQLRAALVDRIRSSRQIEIERDCFRDRLIRLGATPSMLADMVKLYDLQLKARVRAGQ